MEETDPKKIKAPPGAAARRGKLLLAALAAGTLAITTAACGSDTPAGSGQCTLDTGKLDQCTLG